MLCLQIVLYAEANVLWTEPYESSIVFREELETNLTFVGLVVFENRVKSTSKQVIESLQLALIRTLMITG